MRKQLSKIIFILIISLFIYPLISYSQAGLELIEEKITTQRGALKGIQGFHVSIENLPPVAKELGITKELLKTEVELKLRLAGIKIYSHEEYVKNLVGISSLYVNLNIVGNNEGAYVFNIYIALRELAYIQRTNKPSLATIWEYGYAGFTPKASNSFIREELKRGLDTFLNDYLAVNPKK